MPQYEVAQKIMSYGATYQVLLTVKSKLLTLTPNLTMVEGTEGDTVATMTGNFFKTRFIMTDAAGARIGSLTFPMFGVLGKSFTIEADGASHPGNGTISSRTFDAGVFSLSKQHGPEDRFQVEVTESFPREVAILSAVAVDQKFFEGD